MKRTLAALLAFAFLLSLSACRRTDGLTVSADPTASAPTEEPPIVAMYATDAPQLTPTPGVPEPAADATDAAQTSATDEPTQEPTQTSATDEPTQEPTSADGYSYASLTNSTLKVKFAYPDGWESSPSTDTITFVEPVEEGGVAARLSVTSFAYTEATPSTKRLKTHLQTLLKTIVADYNEYQMGTVESADFVGSKGLSVTYLAVQGNHYIRGWAIIGYAKNGRVYSMHFSCAQEDYDAFEPLLAKLAGNVSAVS